MRRSSPLWALILILAVLPTTGCLFRTRPVEDRYSKVALKEMSTYTEDQVSAVFNAAPAGWPQLAVRILLGTGVRVGELVNLELEDVEDDGEGMFLKIKRGKGAKFRRVPVTQRLRREIIRYVNRNRPETKGTHLLVQRTGLG